MSVPKYDLIVIGGDRPATNHGGRGRLAGGGTLRDGIMAVPESRLTVRTARPSTLAAIFSLDRRNGTLIEDTDRAPATGILHRLGPRVGSRR